MRARSAFLLAAFACSEWARAQTPDLQGLWTNSSLTPMERPAELAGKPFLTQQEAIEFEKHTLSDLDRDRRDGGAENDVGRGYNELFFDRGSHLAHISGKIPSSLVVDPADGRIPALTPQAQKRLQGARIEARQHPADRASDRSLQERCLLAAASGPPMLPGLYNNNFQIVQTPNYVMILMEMIHDVRIIPLDGRPHLPPAVRNWLGDSVGHWEGRTLVVDTTNFTEKTGFRGSDQNLHLTERFSRLDGGTLLYEFMVDDPTAFTKSWTGRLPFVTAAGPIFEYACHEGNYALRDILAGARAEERKSGR